MKVRSPPRLILRLPYPPSHSPDLSCSWRSTDTAGGSDPKNLQTPSARRSGRVRDDHQLRLLTTVWPVPWQIQWHCFRCILPNQRQHLQKHRTTLPTCPEPRCHIFAQQTQTPISFNANSPYLGFGYDTLGMFSRNERVGNYGGFLRSNQMSNSQVKTPFYRAHNPTVLRSNSQINSVPLPTFRFLSVPPPLLLVTSSRWEPPRRRLYWQISQPCALWSPRIGPSTRGVLFHPWIPSAVQFYANAVVVKLFLHGQELKIGGGKNRQGQAPTQPSRERTKSDY